jgi:hypothetical protein
MRADGGLHLVQTQARAAADELTVAPLNEAGSNETEWLDQSHRSDNSFISCHSQLIAGHVHLYIFFFLKVNDRL